VPPSEPRPSRGSFSGLDLPSDRPARLQMIVALILLLVLVAIPLYLWRRPRAESIAAAAGPDAAAAPIESAPPPPRQDKVTLGEPKVLGCHDPGPKRTAPADCDHVAELEAAIAKAIEDSASCVPAEAGGGTIAYAVDMSFKRKAVFVSAPREGRTFKGKIAAGCASAVKAKLGSLAIEGAAHQHQRYKVEVAATYPDPAAPARAPAALP
jgi:hypothetical protein